MSNSTKPQDQAIIEVDSKPAAPHLLGQFADILKEEGLEVRWRLVESREGLLPDVVEVIEIAATLLINAATTVALEAPSIEACAQPRS